MKKFSLEEYITHPEKKVVTRDNRSVRIVCTDRKYIPIVALVGVSENVVFYDGDGTTGRRTIELQSDLFFADEEPELTEFEKAVTNCYARDASGKLLTQEELVARAKKLLEIAREELFHNDAVLKEYAETARERGKAEALKDLPRWNKCEGGGFCHERFRVWRTLIGEYYLYDQIKQMKIAIKDLEKLPGFKEDEK